jgi:hypothetical protein
MYFGRERFNLVIMGIDPAQDSEAREYRLREGRFLAGPYGRGALLQFDFARGPGIHEVRILMPHGGPLLKRLQIVGLLGARGMVGLNQAGLIILPVGLAEYYFAAPGQINTIDLVLRSRADVKLVREEVAKVVPAGLDVHPPAVRTQLAEETLLSLQQGLRVASGDGLLLTFVFNRPPFFHQPGHRRASALTGVLPPWHDGPPGAGCSDFRRVCKKRRPSAPTNRAIAPNSQNPIAGASPLVEGRIIKYTSSQRPTSTSSETLTRKPALSFDARGSNTAKGIAQLITMFA